MHVMDACARARVLVFEKAHALMKRIHIRRNGKYTENCWAETETSPKRARWLTLTCILGSVGLLLAFYNREKPLQSVDVHVRRNERCRGEAVFAHAQIIS